MGGDWLWEKATLESVATSASKNVLVIAGATLGAVLAIGIAYFFLSGDAPDPVDIDDAIAANPADGELKPIDGEWTVDTTQSEENPAREDIIEGSFAGFRVQEELASLGSKTAVGRTRDVAGTVLLNGMQLTTADIAVDMTTLVTDDKRRDDNMAAALDSNEFAESTFSLTEPVDLPEEAFTGDPVAVEATGDLTIRGVTRSEDVEIEAQFDGEQIIVTGSTPVSMEDYGVVAPSGGRVFSVEDEVIVEWQLVMIRT